jgi:hypothetical protein
VGILCSIDWAPLMLLACVGGWEWGCWHFVWRSIERLLMLRVCAIWPIVVKYLLASCVQCVLLYLRGWQIFSSIYGHDGICVICIAYLYSSSVYSNRPPNTWFCCHCTLVRGFFRWRSCSSNFSSELDI